MLLLLKHVRRDPRIDFLQWWFEGATCVAGPKTFTLMCIMVQSRTCTVLDRDRLPAPQTRVSGLQTARKLVQLTCLSKPPSFPN